MTPEQCQHSLLLTRNGFKRKNETSIQSTILQVESQDQSKTTIKREEIPNEQGSEGRQKRVRLLN